ncbi:CoA transferase [Sneathiella sp.]|uniref:CoA transferase n=1 Tax=Sneathiella sp. TaxID=1964365 RepID=UPI0035678B87
MSPDPRKLGAIHTDFKATRQKRSSHFSVTPCQTYKAKNGWIFIMCMPEKFWRTMVETLKRSELLKDSRFVTMQDRTSHRDILTDILDRIFMSQTVDCWVNLLGDKIPIGPVLDIDRALESPFVEEIGMISSVPHPAKSDLRLLSNPLRFDGERPVQKVGSALGADNKDYL